ncbi:MAG: hypothetical protein GYA21_07940 [Myxococcales bacterium]|nr:hypothetical protein [Myxococcales bacterium]
MMKFRFRLLGILAGLVLWALGCSAGGITESDAGPDADQDGIPDAAEAGDPEGGEPGDSDSGDAGADATDHGPEDPCPELPIPPTCFERSVVFREWSLGATGDGTYFASQAPWRLGFNRIGGMVWLVKIRLEENTYMGRVSAYGDSTAGVAWIADAPCDPSSALEDPPLVAFGVHGGGSIDFVVAKNDADAERLRSDPEYRDRFRWSPILRGGRCYYAGFENTDYVTPNPLTAEWFATTPDTCGYTDPEGNWVPACYYLAFDFGHLLHEPASGQVFAGNVIDGLTVLP